jgi:hypothetical protein
MISKESQIVLKNFKSNFSRHNDWSWLIRENFQNNITNLDLYNMTQYVLSPSTPSHTDITRLRAGQVGGQVCIFRFSSENEIEINYSFGQFIPVVNIKEKMQQSVLWNKLIL